MSTIGQDAGLLVSRAKDAINVKDSVLDLVKINQYRTPAANVEFLEEIACTITEAHGLPKNMQFDDDPCAIKRLHRKTAIQLCFRNNNKLYHLDNWPNKLRTIAKAHPTSAVVVERSLSKLSKLLRKDRNFHVKNVKNI